MCSRHMVELAAGTLLVRRLLLEARCLADGIERSGRLQETGARSAAGIGFGTRPSRNSWPTASTSVGSGPAGCRFRLCGGGGVRVPNAQIGGQPVLAELLGANRCKWLAASGRPRQCRPKLAGAKLVDSPSACSWHRASDGLCYLTCAQRLFASDIMRARARPRPSDWSRILQSRRSDPTRSDRIGSDSSRFAGVGRSHQRQQ